MIVPNMCTSVLLYFVGFSFVFPLEASNEAIISDVDILNVIKLIPFNVNQVSFEDKLSRALSTQFAFKTTCERKNKTCEQRKIVKRAHEEYPNEKFSLSVDLGFYGYCKLFLFTLLRIFFGIAIDLSKVKKILIKPIGPAIVTVCNFIITPLVS